MLQTKLLKKRSCVHALQYRPLPVEAAVRLLSNYLYSRLFLFLLK